VYNTRRQPKGGPRAIGAFVERALDKAAREGALRPARSSATGAPSRVPS
jgi:hypothetical protein